MSQQCLKETIGSCCCDCRFRVEIRNPCDFFFKRDRLVRGCRGNKNLVEGYGCRPPNNPSVVYNNWDEHGICEEFVSATMTDEELKDISDRIASIDEMDAEGLVSKDSVKSGLIVEGVQNISAIETEVLQKRQYQRKEFSDERDDNRSPAQWVDYVLERAVKVKRGDVAPGIKQKMVNLAALCIAAAESVDRISVSIDETTNEGLKSYAFKSCTPWLVSSKYGGHPTDIHHMAAALKVLVQDANHYPGTLAEGFDEKHILWMLDEILFDKVSGKKAHRWIGWVQAVLVGCKLTTLDKMRELSRSTLDE